jgi:outer membrane protein assembly factor BamB
MTHRRQGTTRALSVAATLAAVVALPAAIPRAQATTAATASVRSSGSGYLQGADHNSVSAGLGGPVAGAWSTKLPGPVSYAATDRGRIFVNVYTYVYALSAATGKVLWAVDGGSIADERYDTGELIASDGVLVVSNRADGQVTGLAESDGTRLWTVTPRFGEDNFSHAVVADGTVYVGGPDGLADGYDGVVALDLQTGKVKWGVNTDSISWPVVADGQVFLASGACDAEALDASNGDVVWSDQIPDSSCPSAHSYQGVASMVAGGRFYLGDGDVVDANTGAPVTTVNSASTPALQAQSLVTNVGGTLSASTVSTGTSVWSFTGDGTITGQPFIAGDVVFAATISGKLYAIDLSTGDLSQTLPLPAGYGGFNGYPRASMSTGDGQLVVPTGHSLTAFRSGAYTRPSVKAPTRTAIAYTPKAPTTSVTGYQADANHDGESGASGLARHLHRRWTDQLTGYASYPVIRNGRVFITAMGNPNTGRRSRVDAFDQVTGRPLWSRALLDDTRDEPVISGGHLYVLEGTGVLLTVDQRTGALRRQVVLAPPARGYLGDWQTDPTAYDGHLYLQVGAYLQSIDLATAKVQWTIDDQGTNQGPLAVTKQSVFIDSSCIHAALRRSDGHPQWANTTRCDDASPYSEATIEHDSLTYTTNQYLNRDMNAKNGVGGAGYTADLDPAFAGPIGFFVANGHLVAENPRTQHVLWIRGSAIAMQPLVVRSRVYDVTTSGQVEAYRVTTGHRLWSVATGHPADAAYYATADTPLDGMGAVNGTLIIPEDAELVGFGG